MSVVDVCLRCWGWEPAPEKPVDRGGICTHCPEAPGGLYPRGTWLGMRGLSGLQSAKETKPSVIDEQRPKGFLWRN